ncbi:hypothetical protein TrLO_g13026 [Triparma laevis f. longispina]|nr:hypothetical protein TrLO_g13026 [Triparma laevis f. longispina]
MDAQALGVPDFGATEPFKLFPSETIEIINSELEKHAHETTFRSPPFAPCVMRGLAHKSEFIRDLWNAPQLQALLSSIVGIPIEPHPMAFERAHINVQEQKYSDSELVEVMKQNDDATGEEQPVFGWHTDSQPLVCITMLSDVPEDAVGGETHIQKADGEVLKLQFPAAGYSYLLQGSVIPHAAMPALNYNRVTMITSFVPTNPLFCEKTDLDLAIKYSPADALTDEFVKYRCDYMSKRLKLLKRCSTSDGVEFCENLLDEIMADLKHTKDSLSRVKDTLTK